ncbi:hypothetical protein [Pseudenterobacter timonensis]
MQSLSEQLRRLSNG